MEKNASGLVIFKKMRPIYLRAHFFCVYTGFCILAEDSGIRNIGGAGRLLKLLE
jgi:hypothetical protein